MPEIRRRSTWARERDAWYRDSALTEIRGAAGQAPFLLGALGLLLFATGGERQYETVGVDVLGAFMMLSGAFSAVLGLELWRGKAWACRVGAWLMLGSAAVGLVALVLALASGASPEPGGLLWAAALQAAWWSAGLRLLRLRGAVEDGRARAAAAAERPPEESSDDARSND